MSNSQWIERADRIAEKTRLSKREAELYVLKKEESHSIRSAAEKMEIAPGNAFSKWDKIKEKVKIAEETVDLDFA